MMSRRSRHSRLGWAPWCLSLALLGCGRSSGSDTELAVFAASSLTEAFIEIERQFEASHPGVDVSTTFAGSQILRVQLERGAPADVFASANRDHMRALTDAGLVAAPKPFATNALAVIVPLDNPAKIESFADLPQATTLVLGTPDVPAGRYARQLLAAANTNHGADFEARVLAHVVSQESSVRIVRAKVELGEADAAIVYRTDALASSRVRQIAIPEALQIAAGLHVGALDRSAHPGLARDFITMLRSAQGQQILSGHGFGGPP